MKYVESLLKLRPKSRSHPESLELMDELLGLDLPDFSVVTDDDPECSSESALLSFFLRPCFDFSLKENKKIVYIRGVCSCSLKSVTRKCAKNHFPVLLGADF